jgi:hypothetical protein
MLLRDFPQPKSPDRDTQVFSLGDTHSSSRGVQTNPPDPDFRSLPPSIRLRLRVRESLVPRGPRGSPDRSKLRSLALASPRGPPLSPLPRRRTITRPQGESWGRLVRIGRALGLVLGVVGGEIGPVLGVVGGEIGLVLGVVGGEIGLSRARLGVISS